MDVELCVFCGAMECDGQFFHVKQIANGVYSKTFPMSVPKCCVAFRAVFAKQEAGVHRFEVRMIDDDGTQTMQPDAQEKEALLIGEDYAPVNVGWAFGELTFSGPCKRWFEVWVDGKFAARCPLLVYKK